MPSRSSWSTRCLLLVSALSLVNCQSLSNWAIGQISPITWNDQSQVELPITMTRWGTPTIPLRVKGYETLALVDSAASLPVMSRSFATAVGADTRASGPEVNGQRREVSEDVPVEIGSASSILAFVVIDEHDQGNRQMSLGADFFHQAVIDMDFDARRIRIINSKAFVPPSQPSLPVKLLNGVPTVQLQLNGHKAPVCAMLDTGYNSGLAVTQKVVDKLSLPSDPGGRRSVTSAAFGERYEQPALAPIREVRLGDFTYYDVAVVHAPSESVECVNLVGMAILSQHRVIFDLQHERVWLLSRSGAR